MAKNSISRLISRCCSAVCDRTGSTMELSSGKPGRGLRKPARQKDPHVFGELPWRLQHGEVADLGLQQQASVGNGAGHELGVLATNGLVVIAVGDTSRHPDGAKVGGSPVRLGRPHVADLLEEALVQSRRG